MLAHSFHAARGVMRRASLVVLCVRNYLAKHSWATCKRPHAQATGERNAKRLFAVPLICEVF